MESSTEWLKFTRKLIEVGARLAEVSSQYIPGNPFSDPKLLSLLLLARTLSHTKSITILMQAKRVLEARILVRNCFENAFYAARFVADGEKFLEEILEDDRKRRNSQGKLLYENGLPVRDEFRDFMKETKGWAKAKTIDVKSVASKGPIEGAYLLYSYLSQDAHPTTNTLSRFFSQHEDETPEINFEPSVSQDHVQETFELCAIAVLGVIVSVNDSMGGRINLAPIADEFQALQAKYQSKSSEC